MNFAGANVPHKIEAAKTARELKHRLVWLSTRESVREYNKNKRAGFAIPSSPEPAKPRRRNLYAYSFVRIINILLADDAAFDQMFLCGNATKETRLVLPKPRRETIGNVLVVFVITADCV